MAKMNREISNTLKILREGGTILYPADTIWGIGCDATDKTAVDKVYKLKKRKDNKGLIILVSSVRMLSDYAGEVNEKAYRALSEVYPGLPVTVIYPGVINLPGNVCAGDGSIGIRVVDNEFCTRLIHEFGKSIVSTSANISEEPAPESFDMISHEIINGVDYVVNLQRQHKSKTGPSIIVRLMTDGKYEVVRD